MNKAHSHLNYELKKEKQAADTEKDRCTRNQSAGRCII